MWQIDSRSGPDNFRCVFFHRWSHCYFSGLWDVVRSDRVGVLYKGGLRLIKKIALLMVLIIALATVFYALSCRKVVYVVAPVDIECCLSTGTIFT